MALTFRLSTLALRTDAKPTQNSSQVQHFIDIASTIAI